MTDLNILRRDSRARPAAIVAGLCILSAATLGACSKDTSAANDTPLQATSNASVVQPAAAPLDYGYLGPPDANEGSDIDAKIGSRAPQKNLALFRHYELHPPQGTEDHPIEYQTLKAISDAQRARFYAAAKGVPEQITPRDWKWVRAEEAYLISSECDDQEASPPAQDADKVPAKVCDTARAASGSGATQ